jgi:hypothetical protein
MRALTEVVPVSAPMVNVTGTGFVVPVKLARSARRKERVAQCARRKDHRLQAHAIDDPREGEKPTGLLEGAGRDVVVKVPA